MVNALGWSRRCAAYFRTDGGKPALAHIMCATLISEGMNLSKWRLLSVVSVRDVFGGTCDIFWGAAGWLFNSVHVHTSCMLFAVDRIIELGSAFALLCFPVLLLDLMCSPLLPSALLSYPLLSSALIKTRADVSANCTDEAEVSHILNHLLLQATSMHNTSITINQHPHHPHHRQA